MILLVGGTTEARNFSKFLNENNIDYFYCAASPTGASLVESNFISSKKLSKTNLYDLINNYGITHIFDLTHPYAVNIKGNAQKVANELGIPYIFYNRPSTRINDHRIHYFNSIEEIIDFCSNKSGNVFLTTGSKELGKWRNFDKERLFVRTLPTIESIQKCDEIGINPKNIIAEFGPFSYEQNYLDCKRLHIKWLVTKESGKAGGFKEKIQAALDLNINPLVLDRPEINVSGLKFDDFKELIEYAKKELK